MILRTLTLGLLAGGAALAGPALADPPGFVGRVSTVEGEVSFQPPFTDVWTLASRNFPVAPGETFWTGDVGRTRLQIGAIDASLDSETELSVVGLDYGAVRLAMTQGSVDLRIWQAPRGGVAISTPAGDVRMDYAGLYRIDVGAPDDEGDYPPVAVTVFEGDSGVPSPEGLIDVGAGEAAVIYAGYDPEAVDPQDAAIDDWARDLEAQARWAANSSLSPQLTGLEDFGAYGDFADNPGYGQVWFPRGVAADWAPYRYGRWAYVDPWGWTWIDDQPWGFAPFHYGRWAQIGGRWGWIAGQPAAEPVYAPALVAFIGGIDVAGGGGGVGWVPLAPNEVYRPSYAVSDAYVRRVNVTNVNQTVINSITVNTVVTVNQYRNAPAAVVVRAGAFAGGAPVQQSAAQVPAAALARATTAPAAARPPAPTPAARTGVAARPSAPGAAPAAPRTAPPPPARLQAIKAAVVAQPTGSTRPPPIAGAKVQPPRPRPAGAPPAALIAPSQVHNPAAQGRRPPPPVQAAPAPRPGAAPPRGVPLKSVAKPPVAATAPRPPVAEPAAHPASQEQRLAPPPVARAPAAQPQPLRPPEPQRPPEAAAPRPPAPVEPARPAPRVEAPAPIDRPPPPARVVEPPPPKAAQPPPRPAVKPEPRRPDDKKPGDKKPEDKRPPQG